MKTTAKVLRFLVISSVVGTQAFASSDWRHPRRPIPPPPLKPIVQTTPGVFDAYVLAVSDENDFCDANPTKKECKTGNAASFGMALHGLWPDRKNDPQHTYQYCGSVSSAQLGSDWCAAQFDVKSQLDERTFSALTDVMPGATSCLYNHEWYAHGTCSGLTSEQYFDNAQELAKKFIGLVHFHDLITSMAGKTVSKDQLLTALRADLGAGADASILLNCRNSAKKVSLAEVDLTLDVQNFLKFPAAESFAPSAGGKGAGNCPNQGILLTPPAH